MENEKGLITGFHHIGLICSDVEKSMKFYIEGLGGHLYYTFDVPNKGKVYMVDIGGGARVELLPWGQSGDEANARWAHIAIATDDLPAAYEAALAAGATPRTPPREGVLTTEPPAIKINAFVGGPDGESIEFFQVK